MVNPVTIKDIADLLGLSKSTVSRALKNHPDINRDTKRLVVEMAEKLRYRPNTVAMSLRNKKSGIIGMIVPHISSFFFPSVIRGVEYEVNKGGYKLMILHSNDDFQREEEACQILMSSNVEGILISMASTVRHYTHYERIHQYNLPIVFYDRVPEAFEADKVLVDDYHGAFRAVKHLINCGKHKIAICLGNSNLLISQNRLKGYADALVEAGIVFNSDYIYSGETPEEVELLTQQILSLSDPPDAIFAISDLTMSGIMRAIYRVNLVIPGDIAVIGFVEEPFASMYHPPVTSIMPMGYEIGVTAAQLLLKRIALEDSQFVAQTINIASDLIVRESTSVQ
mgnify:FL=1